jgi:hypothetical protein
MQAERNSIFPRGRDSLLEDSTIRSSPTIARAMSERLGKLHGGPSYKVEFVAIEGEGHSTEPPAALSRGIQFAFAQ